VDRPPVEVDVLPAQPAGFALAETEREGDGPAGGVAVLLGRLDHPLCASSSASGTISFSPTLRGRAFFTGLRTLHERRAASLKAASNVRSTPATVLVESPRSCSWS
jgi:hypothetical protein